MFGITADTLIGARRACEGEIAKVFVAVQDHTVRSHDFGIAIEDPLGLGMVVMVLVNLRERLPLNEIRPSTVSMS